MKHWCRLYPQTALLNNWCGRGCHPRPTSIPCTAAGTVEKRVFLRLWRPRVYQVAAGVGFATRVHGYHVLQSLWVAVVWYPLAAPR
jgi:hypothetical protein